MRALRLAPLFALLALQVTACGDGDEPAEPAAQPADIAAKEPPPEPPATTPVPAEAAEPAPADDAVPVPPEDAATNPPEGGNKLPSFSEVPNPSGKTVEVTVHVVGAGKAGQVDFVQRTEVDGNSSPKALNVSVFGEDGLVKVAAPADYPEPVYLMASSYGNGESLQPTDATGGYPDKVTLGSEDLDLTITIGQKPAWMKTVFNSDSKGKDPHAQPLPPGEPPPAEGTPPK